MQLQMANLTTVTQVISSILHLQVLQTMTLDKVKQALLMHS